MSTTSVKSGHNHTTLASTPPGIRLERHELTDRMLHWLIATAILALLCTSLLPILGLQFEWVLIHWVTGILLTLAIIVHIVRVLVLGRLSLMKISKQELAVEIHIIHTTLTGRASNSLKAGKYSPAQKGYHQVVASLVLTAIGTGLLMLVKIDSPFWDRDPYLLSQEIWGVVYALHGLSALGSISLIMIHVYFALRPEKLFYTRSMIVGWITRDEHEAHHDPAQWLPDNFNEKAENRK